MAVLDRVTECVLFTSDVLVCTWWKWLSGTRTTEFLLHNPFQEQKFLEMKVLLCVLLVFTRLFRLK